MRDDVGIVPYVSFEGRNISVCLHLTREVARRYAVTERENGMQ